MKFHFKEEQGSLTTWTDLVGGLSALAGKARVVLRKLALDCCAVKRKKRWAKTPGPTLRSTGVVLRPLVLERPRSKVIEKVVSGARRPGGPGRC